MTHTVRLYGYDEATQREALLEEHDFADLGEARECERRLVRAGSGLVTLHGGGWGRTQVRDAEVRVFGAEAGTDDASDMYVMEVLGVTVRVRLVQGEDGRQAAPFVAVEFEGEFTVSVNEDAHDYS